MSVKKGYFIDEFLVMIEKYCCGCDVYVVGVMNVGKLMLINWIIVNNIGLKDLIMIFWFLGIMLDKIEILLDDGYMMVDIFGIIYFE